MNKPAPTRQAMVKRIEKYLRSMDGCRHNYKMASETLKIIEDALPFLANEWTYKRRSKK